MPVKCHLCPSDQSARPAILKRPKTGCAVCKECFFQAFEDEVHHTIASNSLFESGETVAIGASGGKDSTVLAYVLKTLNERHRYGLNLVLLSVDEGITGYRDDSLETVKRNQMQYDLPLKIVSYEELYGWTMDAIVQKIGLKNNCTFCGVFRRQALDRGAVLLKVDKIVTGHNADDIAETVLMNILRGDIARLQRCTAITTGTEGAIPRCKPFKYSYEKEIVMYAYFKKLDYFSTECIYSPNAYRGHARAFLKDLESIRPSAIIDIIHSGDSLSVRGGVRMPVQGTCSRCGYIASQELCKACVLLEGLNRGLPRLGIGKVTGGNLSAHIKKMELKEKTVTTGDVEDLGGGQKTTAAGDLKGLSGGHTVAAGDIEDLSGGQKTVAAGDMKELGGGQKTVAAGDMEDLGGGQKTVAAGAMEDLGGGQKTVAAGDMKELGGGPQKTGCGQCSCSTGCGGEQSSTGERVMKLRVEDLARCD